jgi:hypothetical protein
MINKRYIVRFKAPEIKSQRLTAANVEVYGDHLVFLNADEKPVGIFLLEIVESWILTNISKCSPEEFSESVERGGSTRVFTLLPQGRSTQDPQEQAAIGVGLKSSGSRLATNLDHSI